MKVVISTFNMFEEPNAPWGDGLRLDQAFDNLYDAKLAKQHDFPTKATPHDVCDYLQEQSEPGPREVWRFFVINHDPFYHTAMTETDLVWEKGPRKIRAREGKFDFSAWREDDTYVVHISLGVNFSFTNEAACFLDAFDVAVEGMYQKIGEKRDMLDRMRKED